MDTLNTSVDARQIEHVLSHLARLRQLRGPTDLDALDGLRPAWLRPDTWDIVLEDLQAERYRNRPHKVQLRLVER